MKGSLLGCLIICLGLASGLCCKKTKIDTDIQPPDIKGTWKWEQTYSYNPTGPPIHITPQNTGIDEIVIYYPDGTWSKRQNSVLVDTGSYTTGHASRRVDPWTVARTDSIQYYKNGIPLQGRVDYYFIIVDSMNFNPGYGGMGPGDSKWLIRQ